MNPVIENLKMEAQRNPASNAALHVFALRKRARSTVTLTSLHLKMKKEGFDFSKSDYVPLLKMLAASGLGTLTTTPRGSVKGLVNIKVTLQSLGKAVLNKTESIDSFAYKNKFSKAFFPRQETIERHQPPTPVPSVSDDVHAIGIQISLNGKSLNIPVPMNFTPREVSVLLTRLRAS